MEELSQNVTSFLSCCPAESWTKISNTTNSQLTHLIDEYWHPDHGDPVPHRLENAVHAAVGQEEDDLGVRHYVLN